MIYSKKTDAVLPGQHLLHSNNNDDDIVDVMMMAWGGICAEDMVALNLEAEHKTSLYPRHTWNRYAERI